jgi:threonine/homoserine/homoserine lactone efflux protein
MGRSERGFGLSHTRLVRIGPHVARGQPLFDILPQLMETVFLVKGLIIGFSIAAPVGPIGVLCMRRTLVKGRVAGFVSGLGAASADAIYGCVAAFGLTFVSHALVSQQLWLRLIGGAFLCWLGVRTFITRPSDEIGRTGGVGILGAFASTFLLTLANPMTIVSFAAVFAGLGLATTTAGENFTSATLLVSGVFLGSTTWWLILCSGVAILRSRTHPEAWGWVNRIAGVIITGFGLLAFVSLT